MTPEQDKEISEKLAELYDLDAFAVFDDCIDLWLINDWHQIMELAVANDVWIHSACVTGIVQCVCYGTNSKEVVHELIRNHNNDKSRATRYAIGRALIAIKEQA